MPKFTSLSKDQTKSAVPSCFQASASGEVEAANDARQTESRAAPIAPERREQLKALTGLRIFAAMMIVFYHSADSFGIDHKHIFSSLALVQGVSLFFVLSGFILTYNYPTLATSRDRLKFMLMRLARIWPVHFLTAVAATILLTDHWLSHPYILLPNYLLLQAWIPIERFFFSLNSVSWSVSAELLFYCCFPFICPLVLCKPYRMVALFALMAAAFVGLSRFFPETVGHLDDVTSFGVAYINPLVRIFEFVVGIATCGAYLKHRNQLSRLKGPILHIAEFTIILIVLCFIGGLKHWFNPTVLDGIAPNLSRWVECSSGVFVYAMLVLFFSLEKGWLQNVLSRSLFVWLGEISYSVYLVHWLWIKVFVRGDFAQLHLPRLAHFGLYVFLVLASAALIHAFVEKPVRAYLGRKIHAL
ncbi:MAG TPA: acyltransferase [Oculatellaceae cyanobacterium]